MPAAATDPTRVSAWTARQRGAVLAALAVVAAVFAPTLAGDFVYDDVPLLVQNEGLHDPFAFAQLWTTPLWGEQLGHWRPLTAQLFAIGWWLGDGKPWAIHLGSLLLHLIAALTVAQLWRQRGGAVTGAIAALLLFALHPAQTESVAWCAAQNDVLCGCCTLLAAHQWSRWCDTKRPGARRLALLFCALAMASKEIGVTAPLWCLLLTPRADGALTTARVRDWLKGTLPLWLAYFAARALVFGDWSGGLGRTTYTPPDEGPLRSLAVTAGLLARLVWPVGRDPFADVAALPTRDLVLAGVVVLAAMTQSLLRRSARIGGPIALLLVAVAVPALAQKSLGPYPIADRYLYAACAAPALLLAEARGKLRFALLGIVVVASAALTVMRASDYRDQPTFVARALDRHPDDGRLHLMAGRVALERSSPDAPAAALAAFTRAVEIFARTPQRQDLAVPMTDAHIGIGWALLFRDGNRPLADWGRIAAAFEKALAIRDDRADGWIGLGVVRASTGDVGDAEVAFRRAITLDPGNAQAHHNLGRLLLQRGDRAGAIASLQRALQLAPRDAQTRQLLDAALRTGGK